MKQFETMETDFRSLQEENHQLREYILNLQSQLLEQTRDQSSAPPSPPRRKRALQRDEPDRDSDQGAQGRSAPSPHGHPNTSNVTQGEPTGDNASYMEHIDSLREKYRDYPQHRTSAGGDASYAADGKRAANE